MHEGDDDVSGPTDPHPDDELRAHLARRRAEIAQRLRELSARGRELAEDPGRGPTPDELTRAQVCVEQARMHAREAHTRAAARHDLASEAHLHAAALLDSRGRSDLAREHRAAAEADRAGARTERDAAERDSRPQAPTTSSSRPAPADRAPADRAPAE